MDKNHIIYNKKATNTQNLFNSMKEKKKKLPARLQVGQRGERKNIANNYKVRSRNNETPKNYVYVYIVGILGCEENDINKKK